MAAAAKIVEADGVEALSMRGLARAIGCQPSALYHHVPSRHDVLADVATRLGDALTADALYASEKAENSVLALAAVLDRLLRLADQAPNVWELLFLVNLSEGVPEWWRRLRGLAESLCAASSRTSAVSPDDFQWAALVSLAIAVGEGSRRVCRPTPWSALSGAEIVEMTLSAK